MTTIEVLEAARAKIALPKHWTRGEYGRSESGRSVLDDWSRAVCFCSAGAVAAVEGLPAGEAEACLSVKVLEDICGMSISRYNDSHTHAEVLALFDKAIASLSQPLT